MKSLNATIWVLVAVFVIATAKNVQANRTGIEILSQEHHVWGHIEWLYAPLMSMSDSYDETSGAPISRSVEQHETYFFASSYAGDLAVGVATAAYEYTGDGYYDGAMSQAYVDATWIFRSLTSNPLELTLGFNEELYYPFLPAGHYSEIWLTDITAGIELVHTVSPWEEFGWPYIFSATETYTFGVDPTHEYALRMWSRSNADSDGVWHSDVTAAICVIPAPSAILLGTIGAGCVRWLIRRKYL